MEQLWPYFLALAILGAVFWLIRRAYIAGYYNGMVAVNNSLKEFIDQLSTEDKILVKSLIKQHNDRAYQSMVRRMKEQKGQA
jgi:hypothetical protein